MAVLYIRRYLGTTLNAASRFLLKAGEGGEPVAQEFIPMPPRSPLAIAWYEGDKQIDPCE